MSEKMTGTTRNYLGLVLATTVHLNEIATLLREASNASGDPFHSKKLSGLASGFERMIPCLERLVSAIHRSRSLRSAPLALALPVVVSGPVRTEARQVHSTVQGER